MIIRKVVLTSIAVLFLAMGTLAQATMRYSVRCKGQLFTVYGHHGVQFFRGEDSDGKDGKPHPQVPDSLFRFVHRNEENEILYFRGYKCKYVKDLLNFYPAAGKREEKGQ
jgi:hypothetical protein